MKIDNKKRYIKVFQDSMQQLVSNWVEEGYAPTTEEEFLFIESVVDLMVADALVAKVKN